MALWKKSRCPGADGNVVSGNAYGWEEKKDGDK